MTDAGFSGDRKLGVSRRGGVRRAVHRQHHGDGDGDDRAVADEYRLGAAGGSAQASGRVPLRPGGDGRGARRSQASRRSLRAKAFENAIASVAATGGSTNAVLHLLAMAREAGGGFEDRRFPDDQRADSAAGRSETRREVCRRGRRQRGRRGRWSRNAWRTADTRTRTP